MQGEGFVSSEEPDVRTGFDQDGMSWNGGKMKRVAVFLLVACVFVVASCSGEKKDKTTGGKNTELTILFTSDLLGRIRSCGCAVQDMGGLGRIATYIENVRSSVPHMIAVDAGDDFSLDLSYTRNEADLTFETYNLIGFDAFEPGEMEFIFGLPYLEDLQLRSNFDFVSANIVDSETGKPLFGKAYIVKDIEGLKIGITGVLDDAIRFPAYIDQSGFKVMPVEETLKKILPQMKRECKYLVLLSHLGLERSMKLAGEVGDFDLIVAGHRRPVTKELKKIGKTIVAATGGQGQYMGRLDLTLSPEGKMLMGRMRLVPLTDDIEIHPGVRELFKKYGMVLTDKELDKKQ